MMSMPIQGEVTSAGINATFNLFKELNLRVYGFDGSTSVTVSDPTILTWGAASSGALHATNIEGQSYVSVVPIQVGTQVTKVIISKVTNPTIEDAIAEFDLSQTLDFPNGGNLIIGSLSLILQSGGE